MSPTARNMYSADWVKAMCWWPICPNETSGFSSNWWIGSILTAMPVPPPRVSLPRVVPAALPIRAGGCTASTG